MASPSILTELLSASGDIAYEWDLRADHINWFGAWDRVFGPKAPPPANSKAFYDLIHADDRSMVFGIEENTEPAQVTGESIRLAWLTCGCIRAASEKAEEVQPPGGGDQ